MLKLLKYELIQTYRNYSLIFIVFLGLCFLNSFLVNVNGLATILQISLVIMLVVIYGLMFYNIIKHYSESMFSDKGYLTLTLPVSTHKIVLSKVLATFLWLIVANIILGIGLIITFVILFDSKAMVEIFNSIIREFEMMIRYILTFEGFLTLCVFISSLISFILEIYMFITLVQTKYTRKNKKIVAIILFVVFESIVGYITSGFSNYIPANLYMIAGRTSFISMTDTVYFNLIKNTLFGLLYYFVIVYIIDNMVEI